MQQQATLDSPNSFTAGQLRLRNFPISFFAMVLGMAGTTIAFQRAQKILGLPLPIGNFLLGFTVLLFLVILGVYTIKFIKFPDAVKEEYHHPVRLNFFPTISISLLLLNISFFGINPMVSKILWIMGTILHAIFTLSIMSLWIQHEKILINHFNASWFIPVVGNIIIPVTGAEHGFMQLSWLFFSIGSIFWLVLLTILFNRLIFHQPLPERLIPTLFIMIAPPAVGFISYVKLNHGHVDNFARILYYFGVFSLALVLFQYKVFAKIRFFLSWWAYSFPIAAITIASTFHVHLIQADLKACAGTPAECHYLPMHVTFYTYFSYALLGLLSIVILTLLVRTAFAIKAKEVCVEE